MASSIAPPRGYQPEIPSKIDENTWEFKDGTVYKYSDVTADLTKVHDPNVGIRQYTPADFEFIDPVVEPVDESCFEVVDAFIEAFGENRFLMGPSGHEVGIYLLGGNIEEGGGGFVHGLMQYMDNPETVRAAIRYEVEKNNRLDAQYIRKGQDAVAWGQDFASTQGPFISPAMFREFALPAITSRVANVHDTYHLPVMKHACGNNNELIDMFVEAGYDAYQSIQKSAGMDIEAVKARYGDHFACWGGVSVELLVSGTPEDVSKEVAYAFKHYEPGGRYIFGSTHSIAVGTRYDNFMTMVDEFDRLRTRESP